MKGTHYADIRAIQKTCADILRSVLANDGKLSFEKWLSLASQHIEVGHDYFE